MVWDEMLWTGFMWLRIEPQLKAVVVVMLTKMLLEIQGTL